MSPFICYHATPRHNRESIRRYGLLARHPFSGFSQPKGVYAFSPDMANNDLTCYGVRWDHLTTGHNDLWRIAYVGPMQPDLLVENAVVLPSVTSVTLVTGNE